MKVVNPRSESLRGRLEGDVFLAVSWLSLDRAYSQCVRNEPSAEQGLILPLTSVSSASLPGSNQVWHVPSQEPTQRLQKSLWAWLAYLVLASSPAGENPGVERVACGATAKQSARVARPMNFYGLVRNFRDSLTDNNVLWVDR